MTIIGTMAFTIYLPTWRLVTQFVIPRLRSYRRGSPPFLKERLGDLRTLATGFTLVPLELAFYTFTILHVDSASEEGYWALTVMLVIGFSLPLLRLIVPEVAWQNRKAQWPAELIKLFILRLLIAALVILLWITQCRADALMNILYKSGFRGVLYALLVAFMFGSMYLSHQQYQKTHAIRIWLLTPPFLGLMYYMSLVGFAHCFFPFIPASRGGGDYLLAPTVSIQLEDEMREAKSHLKTFLDNGDPKVVIDETTTTIFVADECINGGPRAWSQNRPRQRPSVWAVRRDIVGSLEYTVASPDDDLRARCPHGVQQSAGEHRSPVLGFGPSPVVSASGAFVPTVKPSGKSGSKAQTDTAIEEYKR